MEPEPVSTSDAPLPPALAAFVDHLASLEARACAASVKAAAAEELTLATDRRWRAQFAEQLCSQAPQAPVAAAQQPHVAAGAADVDLLRVKGAATCLLDVTDAILVPDTGECAGTGEEQVSALAEAHASDVAQVLMDSRVSALEGQAKSMSEDLARALKQLADLRDAVTVRESILPAKVASTSDAAVQSDTPRSPTSNPFMLEAMATTETGSVPTNSFRMNTAAVASNVPKLNRKPSEPLTGAQESPLLSSRSAGPSVEARSPRVASLGMSPSNASVGVSSSTNIAFMPSAGSTMDGREVREMVEAADRMLRRLERESANCQQIVRRLETQAEQWRGEARAARDFRKTMSEDVESLRQRANSAQSQVESLLSRAEKGEQQRSKDDEASRKADRAMRQRVQGIEERISQVIEAAGIAGNRLDTLDEVQQAQAQRFDGALSEQRANTRELLQAQTVLVDEITKLDEIVRDVTQKLADSAAREQKREAQESEEAARQPSSNGSPAISFRSMDSNSRTPRLPARRSSFQGKPAVISSPRRAMAASVPGGYPTTVRRAS